MNILNLKEYWPGKIYIIYFNSIINLNVTVLTQKIGLENLPERYKMPDLLKDDS